MAGKGRMSGSPFHIENAQYIYAIEHENEINNRGNSEIIQCEYRRGMLSNCSLWNSPAGGLSCSGKKCPIFNSQVKATDECSERFSVFMSNCTTHKCEHTCNNCPQIQQEKCRTYAEYLITQTCSECKSNLSGHCGRKFQITKRCSECTHFDKHHKCAHANKPKESRENILVASYCKFFSEKAQAEIALSPEARIEKLQCFIREELKDIARLNSLFAEIANEENNDRYYSSVTGSFTKEDKKEAILGMLSYRKQRIQFCSQQICQLANEISLI